MLFDVDTVKERRVLGRLLSVFVFVPDLSLRYGMQLTMASSRLLVQQTRILVRFRNLSSAVKS